MKRISKKALSLVLASTLAASLVCSQAAVTAIDTEEQAGTPLTKYYTTNASGMGKYKTINVDGDISDWDSSMLIAQSAANDDPRVYRPDSMYEVPMDDYALYAAWDDTNLYLMWEMTNVQDVVAPNDNYPLVQGFLYENQNVPIFLAIDTGSGITGNHGNLIGGGTLWNSRITFENNVDKVVAFSTNGANGPFIYNATNEGIDPLEVYAREQTGITLKWGKGILSKNIYGINKAYGTYNNRVPGDVTNAFADWVDFNTIGHNSDKYDFHYEMSIPLEKLGLTREYIENSGIGVMKISTWGISGIDCLPYDISMSDNADQASTTSQEKNSHEKEDEDHITAAFARIGNGELPPQPTDPPQPVDPYKLGDVDSDNTVGLEDAVYLEKHLAGIFGLNETQKLAADINGNNDVELEDAVLLRKYLAGINTGYPIGE